MTSKLWLHSDAALLALKTIRGEEVYSDVGSESATTPSTLTKKVGSFHKSAFISGESLTVDFAWMQSSWVFMNACARCVPVSARLLTCVCDIGVRAHVHT